MIDAVKRSLAVLGSAFAALALLSGCAASRLVSQQSNPDYVGKSFRSVMVVAVTGDEVIRRTFEDRMVAQLGRRGLKGIQGYEAIGTRGRVEEAELRRAIEGSGAEGVLITRVARVDRSSGTVPGGTVAFGVGWGGFHSYWETVHVPPQQVTGSSWTISETRLFDAKSGTLAWRGVMETRENEALDAALKQYVDVIFDAMARDRVL